MCDDSLCNRPEEYLFSSFSDLKPYVPNRSVLGSHVVLAMRAETLANMFYVTFVSMRVALPLCLPARRWKGEKRSPQAPPRHD